MLRFLEAYRSIAAVLTPLIVLAALPSWALGTVSTRTAGSSYSNKCSTDVYKTVENNETIEVGCTSSNLFHYPWAPEYIDLSFFVYDAGQNANDTPLKTLSWNASLQNDTTFSNTSSLMIISHGYTQNGSYTYINNIRKAYFNRTEDSSKLKVIQLNWPKGALGAGYFFKKNYVQAATNTPMVGRLTAEFLYRVCNKYNINGSSIHLIGHSLGGQVVGEVAAWLRHHRNITVSRVTALDPASPLFSWALLNYVLLNRSDTKFMEIIHTSATTSFLSVFKGAVGMYKALGHVDMYPNGGTIIQPTCQKNNTFFCSHNRDHLIYLDILQRCNNGCDFLAYQCNDESEATKKICERNKTIQQTWAFIEEYKKNLSSFTTNSESKIILYFNTTDDKVNLMRSNGSSCSELLKPTS